MEYNVSYDVCAGVVTLFALCEMLFARDMDRRSNRLFLTVVAMHLTSIVFDIGSSLFNARPDVYGVGLRDAANYVFLFTHTSEAVAFLVFLTEQLGVAGRMRRWQWAAVFAPEALMIALPLALNPATRGVFSYDAAGVYTHGPAMPLLYGAADLYMLVCFALVLRHRRQLSRFQCWAAVMLLLLSFVPMLVQSILMPHQLIEMFFQAIGLYGYMMSVDNIDESRNPVTHAWNRNALARDFTDGLLDDENMGAVIVKVSQLETLAASTQSTRGGGWSHAVRLGMCEWLQGAARQLRMTLYDCDRGVYVALAAGVNADSRCDGFADKAERRFREEWGAQGRQAAFPTQIVRVSFLDEAITAHDFFYLMLQPYFGMEEGVTQASPKDLLRALHGDDGDGQSTEAEAPEKGPAIPVEYQGFLDDFLSRIKDLSPAERRVFDLYVAGYEVGEIPGKAFISINTVKKHNKSIYRKLGVGSREEIRLYVDLLFRCGRGDELTAGPDTEPDTEAPPSKVA